MTRLFVVVAGFAVAAVVAVSALADRSGDVDKSPPPAPPPALQPAESKERTVAKPVRRRTSPRVARRSQPPVRRRAVPKRSYDKLAEIRKAGGRMDCIAAPCPGSRP